MAEEMTQKIDLNKYLEETIVKCYKVKAVLRNIHGEHEQRVQMISSIVYEQTDKISEAEAEKIQKVAVSREKPETVHTFPKDHDGNLLVPLGGARGYIMGALKTAIQDLYKDKLQQRNWKGYGLLTYIEHGVFVTPEWIPVGKTISNDAKKPKSYMVKTAGISGGVITTYYDYIEKAPVEFVIQITNPKIDEEIFLTLLAHIQRLGLGPKGRGRIEITEVVKIK